LPYKTHGISHQGCQHSTGTEAQLHPSIFYMDVFVPFFPRAVIWQFTEYENCRPSG